MNIKLDHMHIEPHGIRTMSKHQLRAELVNKGISSSCDMGTFESISTYFFLRFVYYFQYFIDIREYINLVI